MLYRWSTIARYLPGRTDNEIKNYWRTHFKKQEKPIKNEKKRKFEDESSYSEDQKLRRTMNHTISLDESEENDIGMIIEPPQALGQETTTTFGCPVATSVQQQQSPCVLAQDVARWLDTVADDGLWSGFMWNILDHDHPNQAIVEQPFTPCF